MSADFAWREFGKKNGARESERDGDQQRDGGSNQCAVDKRRGAVIIKNRIPNFGDEKEPAELGAGRCDSRQSSKTSMVVISKMPAAKTRVIRCATSSPPM